MSRHRAWVVSRYGSGVIHISSIDGWQVDCVIEEPDDSGVPITLREFWIETNEGDNDHA